MPTTVSSTATGNMSTNDGTSDRLTNWTLANFTDLAVPDGATINGIELLLDVASGGLSNGGTYFKVDNDTDTSAAKAANENFTTFSTFSNMTVGAANDLWGLSWTPATCNNIEVQYNTSFHNGAGTAYWDFVQVRITYTEAPTTDRPITITSGKILLTSGLITI